MVDIRPADGPIRAATPLPGSKSYTNRALLIAALAPGVSTLRGALFADDTAHMANALGDLGVRVEPDPPAETMVVHGCGGRVPSERATLFCGNAGTAMRFLTALCAVSRGRFVLDGTARMRERPQQPLLDALRQLGVRATSQHDNGCPPLRIDALGCRGGQVRIDGSQSSQYFTALALVAPAMPEGLEIEVDGELVSQPYLDITADIMADFGVTLSHQQYRRFQVAPGQQYVARDYSVEPDASAASYFFAAAAVTGGRITVYGLTRRSRQGDLRFLEVLEQMGCEVTDTPRGLSLQGPPQLRHVTVDMNAISDTALTLAAIAPFADGPVEVRNIAHVRRQESDRIAAAATELGRLGVRVDEFPDGWRIYPGTPHGGEVETYDDHRLAMSFSVLGLRTPGVRIRDPGCVAKTFPNFFARLSALTASGLV
ncbi:MAG: 3-phosphoshikimate 1-carboxyvinyltransferase [Fimbriimonadaceae bacterium]|nr:3-phosphoshikimate 1-carboxyvinyltransferase [Fimbriimonadaceae bacterium]